MAVRNNAFLQEVENRFLSMQRYEDKSVQTKALKLIPIVLLEQKAQERMRLLQKDIKKGVLNDVNVSIQEMLLLELLAWFKNSFFEWIDSPNCDYCDFETKFSHMSDDPKLLVDTKRVEMHRCVNCGQFTPFFRYANLDILLETREGRCGEWADVFTLFCRAMGWDARFVCDATDHVWTEVYSIAQKRWLHCDPCENVCDNPLLYECGWGKQLSYVMAYSYDDIQDVTWRYSADHSKVLANRSKCTEQELIQTIFRLRGMRQRHLSAPRQNFLIRRLWTELVELMVEKKPTEDDNKGRTSGSLAWRLQRGETQVTVESNKIWEPSDHDLALGQITIRYSPNLDQYERILPDGTVTETLQKWSNGVFVAQSMFRKVEQDWKIVYLCREEIASKGEIQWKFHVGNSGKLVDKVFLQFNSSIFENGQVEVQLCGDNKCLSLSSSQLNTEDLCGSSYLLIRATLQGGKGDCAWQHAQLFRQPLTDKDYYPFSVTITFKSKCSVS